MAAAGSGSVGGPTPPRGAALVDAVIAAVEAGDGQDLALPDPLPAEVLETLTFLGGIALPPSLKRWLAFDAAWLEWQDDPWGADCRSWGGPGRPVFATCTIAEAVRDYTYGSEPFWEILRGLPRFASTAVVPLCHGEESVQVLLLDCPDEHGEYPVVVAHTGDGWPQVFLGEIGFDTWLAEQFGVIADPGSVYEPAAEATRRRLFGDNNSLTTPETFYESQASLRTETRPDVVDGDARVTPPLSPVSAARPQQQLPDQVTAERLGLGLVQAMAGRDSARVHFLVDQAQDRFPDVQEWKDDALNAWRDWHGLEVLDRLLAAGADPNAVPALHHAACRDSPLVLDRLLAGGGEVNLPNFLQRTPLHEAAEFQRIDNLRLLLQHGADLNALDEHGHTPLCEAVQRRFHRDETRPGEMVLNTVELLLRAGADPNADCDSLRSPLHKAVDINHRELVALLCQYGADLTARNWKGEDAMQAAWREQRWEVFDALSTAGASATTVHPAGWCLEQVASPDGRSPRSATVEVADRPGEVDYTVELEWIITDRYAAAGPWFTATLRIPERLAELGIAGLHQHPPHTATATWSGPDPTPPSADTHEDGTRYQTTGNYRTRNLAPELLGVWISTLTSLPGLRLASARIHPADPALATTPLDASAWLATPPTGALPPPKRLAFTVQDAGAERQVCVVTADRDLHPVIGAAIATACRAAGIVIPWCTVSGDHLRALGYGQELTAPIAELARTLTLHTMNALHHQHPARIHSIEWNLGVPGPQSTYNPASFSPTPWNLPEDEGPDAIPF
ncbi:ankyrin repeat domain-containing protein [Streptomyces sp. NPDC056661]|uniref:ankyrin repeat domain-containing protein n=1 Tax=Streptomyces sp. NPDC056661 TaxID=3345898 RepID=UPI0036BC5C79